MKVSNRAESAPTLRLTAKKLLIVKQWMTKHLWQILTGVTLPIVLSSLFYDSCKSKLIYTPPNAIWIEGAVPEVPEGKKIKLTARTSPPDNIPDKFNWSPPEMIEGNGQQSVLLDTTSNYRHTETYSIKVSLIAQDKYGNPCPAVEPVSIKVVPMRQWNHPPDWERDGKIHVEGSQEIRAGDPVRLDALATDKDEDKLRYDWSVDSKAVQINGNGNRNVTLQIPPDITRSAFVLMKVRLTVSDGYENGSISDDLTFTITPKAREGKSRGSKRASQKFIITVQGQTSPGQTSKPNSNPPSAGSQSQESKSVVKPQPENPLGASSSSNSPTTMPP